MGHADGFTKKYSVHRLVYFEQYGDIEAAIVREKDTEEMETCVEDSAHRGAQSELG
jgi:predicted GIY-YIG superfamily endonuclease